MPGIPPPACRHRRAWMYGSFLPKWLSTLDALTAQPGVRFAGLPVQPTG
jgi:hypothetical protein